MIVTKDRQAANRKQTLEGAAMPSGTEQMAQGMALGPLEKNYNVELLPDVQERQNASPGIEGQGGQAEASIKPATAIRKPKGSVRPSLVINALSNWAAVGVNIVIGFLMMPFVISYLGKDGYGIWILVGSIIGSFGLLDLGISSAVGRYVAFYAARNDHKCLSETISSALAFFLGVAILILGASFLLATPLASFFRAPVERIGQFSLVLRLLGIAAAVNIVGQVFRATMHGHERFLARNTVGIGTNLVRAGLMVWMLKQGYGLSGVALAALVADSLALVVYVSFVQIKMPQIKLRPQLVQWKRLRPLLYFGLVTSVITVAEIIRGNLDSAVIGRMIGLEDVAIYAVAAIVIRYYSRLMLSGLSVLAPRLAGLQGSKDYTRFRRLIGKALWVSSILSCLGSVLMLILGKRFLYLWIGEGFQQAVAVLMLFSVCLFFEISQYPGVTALFAMNKHKYLAMARAGEALVNLILSILLAPWLGILGVALGTVIPLLMVSICLQPFLISRVVGISLRRYAFPIVACLAAGVTTYAGWHIFLEQSVLQVGYLGLALLGVYISATYLAVICLAYLAVRIFLVRDDLGLRRLLRLCAGKTF